MPLICNMAPVLTRFEEPITIITRSGAYGPNGNWIQNADVSFLERAVVQPDKARNLINAPYGSEANGNKAFWTKVELKVVNEDSESMGDYVAHDGKNYKIIEVKLWKNYGYYRAVGELQSGDRQGG